MYSFIRMVFHHSQPRQFPCLTTPELTTQKLNWVRNGLLLAERDQKFVWPCQRRLKVALLVCPKCLLEEIALEDVRSWLILWRVES